MNRTRGTRRPVLFHYAPDTGAAPCCYDTQVSESRIAEYIGITKGELPPRAYYGRWRSFQDTCDWSWQETRPLGVTREYLGVPVFEGAYPSASIAVIARRMPRSSLPRLHRRASGRFRA